MEVTRDESLQTRSANAGRGWRWCGVFFRIVVCAFVLLCFASPETWRVGMDFGWRYNEALCVRSGLDPYDVCFGHTTSDRFRSVFDPDPGKLPVNAYTPWEYTWALPLTCLPRKAAHMVFQLFNLAAMLGIVALAWRRARRAGLPSPARLTVAAGACFLGLSLVRVLQVSNYGLLMAFAAFAMAECLNLRREILAGLCWSVVLVKPQLGILLAIPLVLGHHFIALATGAGFCALSALPAAALCGANPATMVWRVLHSGTSSIRAGEAGTPLVPPELVSALSGIAPPAAWLAASAALGLALCAWLSWRWRGAPDAIARLAPALVVGLLWMPGHFHDRVLLAPVLAWLLAMALSRHSRGAFGAWFLFTAEFWIGLALAAVLLPALALFALASGEPTNGLLQGLAVLVGNPALRAAYDWTLLALGLAQIAALATLPRAALPGPHGLQNAPASSEPL